MSDVYEHLLDGALTPEVLVMLERISQVRQHKAFVSEESSVFLQVLRSNYINQLLNFMTLYYISMDDQTRQLNLQKCVQALYILGCDDAYQEQFMKDLEAQKWQQHAQRWLDDPDVL